MPVLPELEDKLLQVPGLPVAVTAHDGGLSRRMVTHCYVSADTPSGMLDGGTAYFIGYWHPSLQRKAKSDSTWHISKRAISHQW